MSFRATILVGNKKGKIGVGTAKGPDVSVAVKKATNEAYKNMFTTPITKANTVPYATQHKFKSAVIKLIPASAGTGLKAGSAVRAVLELAGYDNMLSKIIGSNNKLNNAIATIQALSKYKHADFFNNMRDGGAFKEEVVVEEKEVNAEPKAIVVKHGKAVEATEEETTEVETPKPAAKKAAAPAKKAAPAEAKKPAAKKAPAKKASKE